MTRRWLGGPRRLLGRVLRVLLTGRPVKLPTAPIPDTWPAILARRVPLSGTLSAPERMRLLRLTQLFLQEVPMEGCAGLALTEEISVTIAATACLLLLDLPYPRFPRLRRVLVYPDTFVPVHVASRSGLAIQKEPVPLLGEAWSDGIVVLSWDGARSEVPGDGYGRNLVLHEFAHVLDHEDGAADGTPLLDSPEAIREWGRVLGAEFDRAREALDGEDDTALDPYATTNRAEFFAVATEAFFVTGPRLRAHLPALYEQLRRFYRQDPASRSAAVGQG